jgi:hypothetical protein
VSHFSLSAPISCDRLGRSYRRLNMLRKLGLFLLGLVTLGLALPGVASAAEVAIKAVAGGCGHCPFGCC